MDNFMPEYLSLRYLGGLFWLMFPAFVCRHVANNDTFDVPVTVPINAAPLKCFIFGVLLDFDGVFCSQNVDCHVVSAHLSAVKYFRGRVDERGATFSSGLEVTR